MSFQKIHPKKGDILLGHPHSFPFTTFRNSLSNKNWEKVIIYQPYNEDPFQLSYINRFINECDQFIALCGDYWFKRVNKSIFNEWTNIIDQIDLCINSNLYPFIKDKFNKKGERKFLYIGNDYSYNNYAKNTDYLEEISKKFEKNTFGSIGNKKFKNFQNYGWLNLKDKKNLDIIKKYDFIIHTSTNDANPSTVLEGMSWGLVPIITKETGHSEDSIIYIPLNDISNTKKILDFYQNEDEKNLIEIQQKNLKLVKEKYNWKNYRKKIRELVLKKKSNRVLISRSSKKIFFQNEKKSPNYFLNLKTIYSVSKYNLSLLVKYLIYEKKQKKI